MIACYYIVIVGFFDCYFISSLSFKANNANFFIVTQSALLSCYIKGIHFVILYCVGGNELVQDVNCNQRLFH